MNLAHVSSVEVTAVASPDDAAPALVPEPAPPPDRQAARVYLAGLASPASRATMARALAALARHLAPDLAPADVPWLRVRYAHAVALRTALAQRHAPAYANKLLAALRGVCRAAWLLGQMPAEEYQKVALVGRVRGAREPKGRAVTDGELAALAGACGAATAAGARDAALLALLHTTGMRRAEVAALQLADLDLAAGTVRFLAKGNKERTVFVGQARAALAAWLAARGAAPGPLFLAVHRSGRVLARGLQPSAVFRVLERRSRDAGLAQVAPHDLRRTMVTAHLERGADIALVQRLAGHASPATTARYDRRGKDAERAAAEALPTPFGRRAP